MTRRVADFVFSIRPLILLLFLLGTAVMIFYTLQLRVDAGFKKQLPLEHEYMQTFIDYEREFGGANRVMVALMARDGEMFTPEFSGRLRRSATASSSCRALIAPACGPFSPPTCASWRLSKTALPAAT